MRNGPELRLNPRLERAAQVCRAWLRHSRHRLATLVVCLLALLILTNTIFGDNGLVAYRRKKAEHRQLQQEIEALRKENQRIAREVHRLKTDPAAIEREAREQLRYARPGEVVYVLPQPQPTPAPPPATADKR